MLVNHSLLRWNDQSLVVLQTPEPFPNTRRIHPQESNMSEYESTHHPLHLSYYWSTSWCPWSAVQGSRVSQSWKHFWKTVLTILRPRTTNSPSNGNLSDAIFYFNMWFILMSSMSCWSNISFCHLFGVFVTLCLSTTWVFYWYHHNMSTHDNWPVVVGKVYINNFNTSVTSAI